MGWGADSNGHRVWLLPPRPNGPHPSETTKDAGTTGVAGTAGVNGAGVGGGDTGGSAVWVPGVVCPTDPALLILPAGTDSEFWATQWRANLGRRAALIAALEKPQKLLDELAATTAAVAVLHAKLMTDLWELVLSYPADGEFLPTEVGLALKLTDRTVQDLLFLSGDLATRLPHTAQHLQYGRVGLDTAAAVSRALRNVTDDTLAARVDELIAPALPQWRQGQVAPRVAAVLLRLDPSGAATRHRKAKAERHVWRRAQGDGMATLGIIASAADITVLYEGITALGHTGKHHHHDGRTAGQLHVDTLVELFDQILTHGTVPHFTTHPDTAETAETAETAAARTRAADSGADSTDQIETDQIETDQIKTDQIETDEINTDEIKTDVAESGVTDSGVTESDGIDSGVTESVGAETAVLAAGVVGVRQTPGGCGCCGGTGRVAASINGQPHSVSGVSSGRGGGGRGGFSIGVLMPHTVLFGSDEPCYRMGYGPISAAQALKLAADHPWRRMITDPLSGELLDLGRKQYLPPASLAEHIRLQDLTCYMPGCPTEAAGCQTDHLEKFHPARPEGASTSAVNLGAACQHHHRAKDSGAFTVLVRGAGSYEWTTPLGRKYLRAADPMLKPDPDSPENPQNWWITDHPHEQHRLFTTPPIGHPAGPRCPHPHPTTTTTATTATALAAAEAAGALTAAAGQAAAGQVPEAGDKTGDGEGSAAPCRCDELSTADRRAEYLASRQRFEQAARNARANGKHRYLATTEKANQRNDTHEPDNTDNLVNTATTGQQYPDDPPF